MDKSGKQTVGICRQRHHQDNAQSGKESHTGAHGTVECNGT